MSVTQKKSDEELALEEAEEVKEEIDKIYTAESVVNLRLERQKLLLELKIARELIKNQQEEHEATYNYLTTENTEKAAMLILLRSQLSELQVAQDSAVIKYDTHVEALLERQVAEEAKAKNRIEELEIKLFHVKEYMRDKGSKDDSLKALQDTLDNERKRFEAKFEGVEMRGVVERDRLRKEFGVQMVTMKKELNSQVNKKLTSKTKKALMVNIFVTKQLMAQQQDAEVVKKVNDKVAARDKRLQLELQLAESHEEEIMARLHSYQQVIKQLQEVLTAERIKADEQTDLIRLKDEIIFNLEEKLQKLLEQSALDEHRNRHLNSVWTFLSREVTKMKILSPMESSAYCQKSQVNQKQQFLDKDLLRLITAVVRKYPKKFRFLSKSYGGSVGGSSCHSLMSLILEENDDTTYNSNISNSSNHHNHYNNSNYNGNNGKSGHYYSNGNHGNNGNSNSNSGNDDDFSIISELDDDDHSAQSGPSHVSLPSQFSLPSLPTLPTLYSPPNRMSYAFTEEIKAKPPLVHRKTGNSEKTGGGGGGGGERGGGGGGGGGGTRYGINKEDIHTSHMNKNSLYGSTNPDSSINSAEIHTYNGKNGNNGNKGSNSNTRKFSDDTDLMENTGKHTENTGNTEEYNEKSTEKGDDNSNGEYINKEKRMGNEVQDGENDDDNSTIGSVDSGYDDNLSAAEKKERDYELGIWKRAKSKANNSSSISGYTYTSNAQLQQIKKLQQLQLLTPTTTLTLDTHSTHSANSTYVHSHLSPNTPTSPKSPFSPSLSAPSPKPSNPRANHQSNPTSNPKHRNMKSVVTISARPGKTEERDRHTLVPKYNFKSVADLLRG